MTIFSEIAAPNIARFNIGSHLSLSTRSYYRIKGLQEFATACVPEALVSNLLAYWKMNEITGSLEDFSGNSQTAIPVNAPASIVGVFGNARDFDGTNWFERLGGAGILAPAGEDRTFNCWVNPSVLLLNATAGHRIIQQRGQGPSGTLPGWTMHCRRHSGSGTFRVWILIEDDAGNFVNGQGTEANIGAGVFGIWRMMTVTIERAPVHLARLWFNGIIRHTLNIAAFAGNDITPANNFSIGAPVPAPTAQEFIGGIDEISVYNRALTSVELLDLNNGNVGRELTICP